ncbi:arylamine N-acetyltransferase family protein [Ectobacillus ponti]|uniref:Arylamine N-acetyltransferase n=1 Tax=Ectobacillus ponti TaxID=2961894 RepID=A0AA41X8V8_9BACI|nr:arylamine N-acetyltransferase [Ectobacillus ponti]MCP8971054.1 arylamine N-acetyltransferase [Ectobacillus ponti]
MTGLDAGFRKRIGFSKEGPLAFADLPEVLERTSRTIPFENLCVLTEEAKEITSGHLAGKILERGEGGLCYELNGLLYFVLQENGFSNVLVRGVVYNPVRQEWSGTGRTHVVNLLPYESELYLIDSGFGSNIPLAPVPLTGETVTSPNGEFRARPLHTEHGDFVFEMKIKHKDADWQLGYAFDSIRPAEPSELSEIQAVIRAHPASSFNKTPLLTRLTEGGSVTLTHASLTEWKHGKLQKDELDEARFKSLARERFGIHLS